MDLITIKIKTKQGWTQVKMSDLKVGDKFRAWQPDGTVIRHNNKYILTAVKSPKETKTESGEKVMSILIGELDD
jgi:hypothetical protein